MNIKMIIPAVILCFSFLLSCEKSKEVYVEQYPVSSFFNLKIGDSSVYRLDSLEFTVAAQNADILNSYIVKEFVTDTFRDNLNQKVWKITREINKDTTGKGFWQFLGEYFISIQQNQVDIIEDNRRFIKLKAPVRENFSWKGNSFLPYEAFPQYNFSINNNIAGWDYTYGSVGQDEILQDGDQPFTKVCTIEQINQSSNLIGESNEIDNRDAYASREKSIEKYAQNVGLIYKEQALWEYQPTRGKKIGFVTKMWRVNK